MTAHDLDVAAAETMIMTPRPGRAMTTSGDAMARVREKYGRGVAGLALWQRIVITIAASVPAAFWFFVSLFTTAPGNALTLAVAVLFAAPLYVLVPALWERTEESVRTDWHARRVEKQLELEVGVRERAPRIDHDRPVPKRW